LQFTSTPPLLPGCSLNAWCTVQAAVLMRSGSPLSLCLLPRWLNEFSHCRVQWKMSSRGWRSQQQLAGSLCKPLLYSWKLSMHVNAVSTPSVSAPWAAKSAWDGWCQIFIFISLLYSLAKDSSVILFVEGVPQSAFLLHHSASQACSSTGIWLSQIQQAQVRDGLHQTILGTGYLVQCTHPSLLFLSPEEPCDVQVLSPDWCFSAQYWGQPYLISLQIRMRGLSAPLVSLQMTPS